MLWCLNVLWCKAAASKEKKNQKPEQESKQTRQSIRQHNKGQGKAELLTAGHH